MERAFMRLFSRGSLVALYCFLSTSTSFAVVPHAGTQLPAANGEATAPSNPNCPGPNRRQWFEAQLASNSDLKRLVFASTQAEVGGLGQEARIGYMETIFNRAVATNKNLTQIITDPNYYPDATKNKLYNKPISNQAEYEAALEQVLNGSNLTGYATDNASVELAQKRENALNPGIRIGNASTPYGNELFYVNMYGSGDGGVKAHADFYKKAEADGCTVAGYAPAGGGYPLGNGGNYFPSSYAPGADQNQIGGQQSQGAGGEDVGQLGNGGGGGFPGGGGGSGGGSGGGAFGAGGGSGGSSPELGGSGGGSSGGFDGSAPDYSDAFQTIQKDDAYDPNSERDLASQENESGLPKFEQKLGFDSEINSVKGDMQKNSEKMQLIEDRMKELREGSTDLSDAELKELEKLQKERSELEEKNKILDQEVGLLEEKTKEEEGGGDSENKDSGDASTAPELQEQPLEASDDDGSDNSTVTESSQRDSALGSDLNDRADSSDQNITNSEGNTDSNKEIETEVLENPTEEQFVEETPALDVSEEVIDSGNETNSSNEN